MKKILFFLIALMVVGIFNPADLNAKPIWIKFKIGLFAKWSITFNGNCEDGKGLCIAFGDNLNPNSNLNFFGYDDSVDKFYFKISKQWSSANSFSSGSFEIGEDSPVDPKLIESISTFGNNYKNVFIKKGVYKVNDEGDYYLLALEHYLI